MLFNSIEFIIFLPLVFTIYWLLNETNLKIQNTFILFASYLFYGWWDFRFLCLIIFSTTVDFSIGLLLNKSKNLTKRKFLLVCSIIVNLGLLGFFKYYNFFIENLVDSFTFFGGSLSIRSLNIFLPVGISFYTFQTLSYTIDIYRRKLEPTQDFIAFSAFVSFFPQLVAGPIERASHLLPQIHKKRKFQYEFAVDGLRQMLWGFFKKIVIADNCAKYVDIIFTNDDHTGSTVLLAGFLFMLQVYCDFSGYSDIAIGTSRLFGIDLKRNFNFPLFSQSIQELWRKWHITLSFWVRDYIYIPLGRTSKYKFFNYFNTLLMFIIIGFWHGANWPFIFFGIFNGFLVLLDRDTRKSNSVSDSIVKLNFITCLKVIKTVLLFSLSTIVFRSSNLKQAIDLYSEIFSFSTFSIPFLLHHPKVQELMILIMGFMGIEWLGRKRLYATESLLVYKNVWLRWSSYFVILFIIYYFGSFEEIEFVYFQF